MRISHMFLAPLCIVLLASHQISAVVNNGKPAPVESSSDSASSSSSSATTAKVVSDEASSDASSSTNTNSIADSVAAGTDQEANRREAPLSISIDYGGASGGGGSGGGGDSYVPSAPSNPGLPVPIYGVPDAPSNNIVYPGPPPDIPPPISTVAVLPAIQVPVLPVIGLPAQTYGPPQPIATYGPPLQPPQDNYGPPPPPPIKYGPPQIFHQRPPKPLIPPPFHKPKPIYGPPHGQRPPHGPSKPLFIPKQPKPGYGPPKPFYGPPKQHHHHHHQKPHFPPQKQPFNNFKGPGVTVITIPQGGGGGNYGPPKDVYGPPPGNQYGPPPSPQYGPPEPIPHGPPHPGAPAPPTPPDIKYDGWHPIPGLVSRPPSSSYGAPEGHSHGGGGSGGGGGIDIDLHLNADFTPPPVSASHGISSQSLQHSHSVGNGQHGLSDSYGAPLNTVTGSGGVVSTSGDSLSTHDDHSISLGLSAAGINGADHNQLSVIKSIQYELFPNSGAHAGHIEGGGGGGSGGGVSGGGGSGGGGSGGGLDSYIAPPSNSFSATGPYAAAHSYNNHGVSSSLGTSFGSSHQNSHHNSHHHSHGHGHGHGHGHSHGHSHGHGHGLSLSSSGIGLIPPSGQYGVPPSGHYGTPLLHRPNNQYGPPLNALKINPPKRPVFFREPVPTGLIQSIGHHTAHKDAHGIIGGPHHSGPTYIPPPVKDISGHVNNVNNEIIHPPSNLYSLPSTSSAVSFQNVALSSSGGGIDFGGHALTSYTAPLNSVDGAYGLTVDTSLTDGASVGIDTSHPALTIDLTGATGGTGYSFQQQQQHQGHVPSDCSLKSQQGLPSLSYGVPSANTYTQSLSSLTTNIGGGYQGPPPAYGPPDQHAAHSQTVGAAASNAIDVADSEGKSYGKSLTQSFGPGGELIKSDSIDINNIPVQGSLGSYTLQIQPADGLGTPGAAEGHPVHHAQVLNDGLLQSILAAIEQPNQSKATIFGHPVIHFQPGQQSFGGSELQVVGTQDAEPQYSATNAVVVNPPVAEASTPSSGETSSTEEPSRDTDAPLHLIDNNEIALYFSNNPQTGNNTSEVSALRNGQQYGSYVSFKGSNSSYVYGDLEADKNRKAAS